MAMLRKWWRQMWCRHRWQPVHHSYRCVKCDALDKEF